MKARFDDRLGVSAVTYALFSVTPGPGLALSLVLVFAIWIGWRRLCQTTGRTFARFARMPPLYKGQELHPPWPFPVLANPS